MNNENSSFEIKDVTDTAIWVAAYRAEETERKDALFKDLFARELIGTHGSELAARTQGSRYTAWSVVMRTYIIDQFILNLVAQNIDTVINLGAGLDTRPYRLELPSTLRWIEADFPKIIEHKEEKLKAFSPRCILTREKIDLADIDQRNIFLKKVSTHSQNVLILTEGVVPYLSNHNAESLAQALHQYKNFRYWITEYYSPEILKFLRTPKRLKQMQNAPFLFNPEDWFGFYKKNGWNQIQTKYFGVESGKLGRTAPTPGWLKDVADRVQKDSVKYFLGYSIYERADSLPDPLSIK